MCETGIIICIPNFQVGIHWQLWISPVDNFLIFANFGKSDREESTTHFLKEFKDIHMFIVRRQIFQRYFVYYLRF